MFDVYESNRSDVWKIIEKLSKFRDNNTCPSDDDLFKSFKDMADIQPNNNFNPAYEAIALDFLHQYNKGEYNTNMSLKSNIFNDTITEIEVVDAIDLTGPKVRGSTVSPLNLLKAANLPYPLTLHLCWII